MPSKSVDLDLVKKDIKDIGSDSNSLPGHDRSRVDSDKQVFQRSGYLIENC